MTAWQQFSDLGNSATSRSVGSQPTSDAVQNFVI